MMQTVAEIGQRQLEELRAKYAQQLRVTPTPSPHTQEHAGHNGKNGNGANWWNQVSTPVRPQIKEECSLCRGLGRVRTNVPIGQPGFGTLVPCSCQAEAIRQREFARLSQVSGMLPEELSLRLDDVQVDPQDQVVAKTLPMETLIARQDTVAMLELAHRFVEQPWGFLTLHGTYGNAKTLILQAVVNEFREQRGITGVYVKMRDLLNYVRAGYAPDAQENALARYERLKAVPVLAIDEIDAAKMTDFAYEFRAAFLDDRYRLAVACRAHTLFAMNGEPSELPGDLYDRMRDGRFVVFHNADASMRPVMG
ncbi:MAG: AAA family ATPase [Chloroflexi bacterium]|nr:AAA family ATPase [Chloroflexota bacterium]